MKIIPPLRIILSGGGIRSLAYIGVFQELEQKGLLKNINEVLGVSSGSLFGFGFCLGYTPHELFLLGSSMDFSLVQNLDPDIAFDFFSTYGIDDGKNLDKFIESVLKAKGFSSSLTLLEMYEKTNKYFRCFAVNLNNCSYKEFSHKKTPNTTVLFSLRASMCIPGYFIPLIDKETNHYYVDGGLINNYPIDLIESYKLNTTLGFTFSEDHTNITNIDTLEDFFNQIFACSYLPKKNLQLKKYNKYTVIIPCGEYHMINFNASYEDRLYLINSGRKAILNYYNILKKIKPYRRNSL